MCEPPEGQTPAQDSAENSPNQERGPWWLFWQKDRVAGFTGWIAIFTVIIALVGIFQAYAFVKSERAFVIPTAMDMSPTKITAGVPVTFMLTVKNSGHSFAIVKYMDIYSVPYEALPAKRPYEAHTAKRRQPIPVDGTWPSVFSNTATQKQADAINGGTTKLYIFGRVIYTDEFSLFGSWETGFCYIYKPNGDPKVSLFDICPSPAYTYAE